MITLETNGTAPTCYVGTARLELHGAFNDGLFIYVINKTVAVIY